MIGLKKHWRTVVAIGVTSLLLFAIGVAAASYYLNGTAFRQMLIDRLNTVMAGSLAVGHHRLSLAGGRAVLSDVVLTGTDGTPLAVVGRLQVRLFWPALVWREIRITRLSIEMSELWMTFDHQDRLQMIRAFSSPDGPSPDQSAQKPWQVRIDDFELNLGAMVFQRPALGWTGEAGQIKIAGRADLLEKAGGVRADVGHLAWKGPNGSDQSLEDLTITASFAPSKDQPLRLEIKMPDSAFSVQGDVDWQPGVPRLDLSYSMDLDLARIRPYLPADVTLVGRAKGKGNVKGPLDDPSGTLGLEITQGRINDFSLDRLGLDLTLDQRKVTLKGLQVRSAVGQVDVTGTVDLQPMFVQNWREATAGLESPVYDLKLDGRDLQPGQWPKMPLPLGHGKWRIHADVAGRGIMGPKTAGRADITLGTTGARAAAASRAMDGDLSAELVWAEQVLDIRNCTAATGPNKLNAHGRIDLAARQMDVRGILDIARMEELGAIFGVTAPKGRGTLTLHGHGAMAVPTIRASLLAQDLAWADWTIGRVLAESELAPNGVLTVSRLALENQGSLIEGQGTLALINAHNGLQPDPAVNLALDFKQLEPADFYTAASFRGHFNGRIELGGTLQHLTGDMDLGESPLSWRDLACLAKGKAHWADGRLTVPELSLSSETSALHLQGSALWRNPANGRWMAEPKVRAKLQTRTLHLKDLDHTWSGTLALQAQVSGPASDLQGSFHLEGGPMDLGIQTLHALKVYGRLLDKRLWIDRMTAGVAAGQEFEAHGWYGFDQRYALSLEGEGVDLKHIVALQRAHPVTGRLDLHLGGSGTIAQPILSGDITVRGPRFNDRLLDDFRMQLRLQENQMDLDADLNFMLKCRVWLDTGNFNLQAVFDRSDLSPYLAMSAGPLWSGHLSGDLQAKGNWHAPMKAKLSAALTDARLNYQTIPFVSVDKLNIALEDGALEIPSTRIAILREGHLELHASGELQEGLNLQADGSIPLAALAPFSEQLADGEGEFEVHLRARGPLAKINWEADLRLSDLGMTLPGLSKSIRDLNGHMTINPRALIVENLAGALDSGGFTANGRVRLEELRPVSGRLNFSARALPLHWPGTMDVVLHGDLRLEGKPREAVLAGNVDLVEGTYYKDVRFNLLSAVTRPKRRRATPSTNEPPQWMETIRLDVTMGHRNPLLVDNNLSSLRIAPNLRLVGTLARPVLNGRAQVTDGRLIYRRKSFEVKRGVVDFINPYTIEPNLDILSEARIRKWQVSLAVSGTPDQLQLKLSSDPPEADNDILSLVLLGRTNEELMKGSGGESQTTTQMLAALLATAWGEDVKKTTGLDILELETGAQEESDSQDRTQVTLGKKLSRRLTLKYALESNHGDMIQKAISEYRFLEHLLVSGFQDSAGDYGGELVFRIEFE